jgi:hypothetical protein
MANSPGTAFFWCKIPLWLRICIVTYLVLETIFIFILISMKECQTKFGGLPESIVGFSFVSVLCVIGLAYYTKSAMVMWDTGKSGIQVYLAAFQGIGLLGYSVLKFIVTLPCRNVNIKNECPKKKKRAIKKDGELDFDEEWVWDD